MRPSFILAFFFPIFVFGGHDTDWHFIKWLQKHYKVHDVKAMLRNDLRTGSFGGGPYKGDVRPVILIHGMNNEAGNFYKIRANFVQAGFPKARIFATSWGNGQKQNDFGAQMSCGYIQHIRKYIEAVIHYTGSSQVDIIGYSMGSPMARKAILGGPCVDNWKINIGVPITYRIHTFISVAGANQGSYLCTLPFFNICNSVTGLSCNSKFLHDVNSKKNYEATSKVYNLASTSDVIVGYNACGKRASHFDGAVEHKIGGLNHEQTEYDTAHLQLALLRSAGISKKHSIKSYGKKKTYSSNKNDPYRDVRKYLRMSRRRQNRRHHKH